VVLTFISAELFTSTGQSIRGLRRDQTFLPVSYAAPLVGYLPDLRATQTGGYEVESAWQFYGQPAPFQPGSDRVVIKALEGMLDFLESKER
jgi:hypothetical protein